MTILTPTLGFRHRFRNSSFPPDQCCHLPAQQSTWLTCCKKSTFTSHSVGWSMWPAIKGSKEQSMFSPSTFSESAPLYLVHHCKTRELHTTLPVTCMCRASLQWEVPGDGGWGRRQRRSKKVKINGDRPFSIAQGLTALERRQRMRRWTASQTWWTWVWSSSGSWWWTGRPGVLQSTESPRVGHDWTTELNWRSKYGFFFLNPQKQ